MKKTLSVLLALLICFTLMTTAAFAADTCIVAGVTELCGSFWTADDVANAMSLNGSVYEKVYPNVAVGDYQFKIVYNGQWKGTGNNGQDNVSFHVSSPCDVKITYNPVNDKIEYTGTGVGEGVVTVTDIYVAGEKVDAVPGWVNGENWNAGADSNKTAKSSNGIYTITYKELPAGEYKFKFAADKAWTHSWGGGFVGFDTDTDAAYNGDNIVFTLSEQSDVTLKLDLTGMDGKGAGAKFTVALNSIDPPDPTDPTDPSDPTEPDKNTVDYYVAGCKELCGVFWEANTLANKMTRGSDGIYTKVFQNLPKGTYQLKVTDGTWGNSWGGDGPEGNYEFTLDTAADVTVKFDPTTKTVSTVTGNGYVDPTNPTTPSSNAEQLSKYRVVGSAQALGNWDPAFEQGRMTEVSPGVYSKTFPNLPAGDYEFKITDGTWANSYGDSGANYKLKLEANKKVIITFTLKDGNHSVNVRTAAPDTADFGMIGFIAAALVATVGVSLLLLNKKKMI